MNKIGIICALKSEIKYFFKFKIPVVIVKDKIYKIYLDNDRTIIIFISGVGKVNAAFSVNELIKNYKINFLINIGTCGLIKKKSLNNINLIKSAKYFDVDLTDFNYPYGKIPKIPLIFDFNSEINKKIYKILEINKVKFSFSNILSGDSFISNNNFKNYKLVTKSDNFNLIDMESAAVFHTCYLNNFKNLIIIKIISDLANNDNNAAKTFKNNVNKYEYLIDKVLKILINSL